MAEFKKDDRVTIHGSTPAVVVGGPHGDARFESDWYVVEHQGSDGKYGLELVSALDMTPEDPRRWVVTEALRQAFLNHGQAITPNHADDVLAALDSMAVPKLTVLLDRDGDKWFQRPDGDYEPEDGGSSYTYLENNYGPLSDITPR